MQQAVVLSAAPYNRRRTRLGDPIFSAVAGLSGVFVLVLMGSLILSLFVGGLPAFLHFGPGFLTSGRWDPVHEVFGAAVSVYGTLLTSVLALAFAIPISFGIEQRSGEGMMLAGMVLALVGSRPIERLLAPHAEQIWLSPLLATCFAVYLLVRLFKDPAKAAGEKNLGVAGR